MGPDLLFGERRDLWHNHGFDRHAIDRIGNPKDRGLADSLELVEDILDLLRADLLPAAHKDVVCAADEVEEPFAVAPDRIAR